MIFEVEFLCSDLRPLLKKNEGLVDFLKPLHLHNKRINETVVRKKSLIEYLSGVFQPKLPAKKSDKPYYRNIGIFNTKNSSKRAFFKARNSIKLLDFEKHWLDFPSKNYQIFRGNHVRRHFSTDDFGVVNRLKLGFEFFFIPQKEDVRIDKEKETFKFLEFIFGMRIKTKKNENTFPFRELGKWMSEVISDSTKCRVNKQERPLDENVTYIGAIAVIIYRKDELPGLPKGSSNFWIDNCPENITISYYTFSGKSEEKDIRVYMIQHEDACAPDFLYKLKSHLLDFRINFLSLEHVLLNKGIYRKEFVLSLTNKICDVRKNKRYGFIDLKDQDKGEICGNDIREEIDKKVQRRNSNLMRIS